MAVVTWSRNRGEIAVLLGENSKFAENAFWQRARAISFGGKWSISHTMIMTVIQAGRQAGTEAATPELSGSSPSPLSFAANGVIGTRL